VPVLLPAPGRFWLSAQILDSFYLYHEFKESNENKIRKELDELKKRIEELENNNR
jgi:hypothetical protein